MKCICKRKAGKEKKGCCLLHFLGSLFRLGWELFRIVLKVVGKLAAIFAPLYAALFAVFYFDLDGKLLYYVVEPFLCKHYDKMERKNPLEQPYDMMQ